MDHNVYRLPPTETAALREHATTAGERIALEKLEHFEGDAGDVDAAFKLCVRTGNTLVAETLGYEAPDVAHRIGVLLRDPRMVARFDDEAKLLRVSIAMHGGAIRRLEAQALAS